MFKRKLKELLAGQDQTEVAARMNYTQSRVSQMCRGERPSRQFVERLVETFGLDRDEWLESAGFSPKAGEPDIENVIRRTVQETLRQSESPDILGMADRIVSTHEAQSASLELEYEPYLEGIEIVGYRGDDGIPPEDRELALKVLRAVLSESRRRQDE